VAGRPVGKLALELLSRVEFHERRDQPEGPANRFAASELVEGVAYSSVGLSYNEILRRVRERFPGALEGEIDGFAVGFWHRPIAPLQRALG
jgi:hypothetical protein